MVSSKLLKKFDFVEEDTEILERQYGKTGFPEPKKRYNLSWEVYDLSLEEPYFWVLEVLKQNFPIIVKVEDAFAAAENSAFFGVTQQKLGAQQDKVSQFLATVGKMIKELFQMVRELRIIDERLGYYGGAEKQLEKPISERGKSDEITLKGLFVDLVQGGAKSASSVFGMARELEFLTLPDLFFDAPPFKSTDELEKYIKGLEKDFNLNVLRVLERHLRQFQEWKKRTSREHRQRREFSLKYLFQHFEIIKMYVTWVKPYLRHVERLTMKEKNMSSADIVSAFEGSMLDVEVLAQKPSGSIRARGKKVAGGYDCILATFNYRTRPEMKVVQEGYQRGPIHIGRYEMNIRVYRWTDQEIKNYQKMKEKESLDLMGNVSAAVQQAMTSLGKELDKYLEEAGRKAGMEEEKEKKPKKESLIKKLFGDFYSSKPESEEEEEKVDKGTSKAIEEFKKESPTHALTIAWTIHHTFKKAHGMIAW